VFVSLRSRLGGLYWGRKFAAGGIRTWMHEPTVRRYINECVSGSPDTWPIDWLAIVLGDRRFGSAISLGCGAGALERDLLAKAICSHLLGIDVSADALSLARSTAAKQGLVAVVYTTGGLNKLSLPEQAFQAAFFHQSLHHVEHLDRCLSAVAAALQPGGLLYLDEYVGPSRHMWSRALLSDASDIYSQLPRSVRRSRRLQLPVDWRDPTEAIASSEILDSVGRHFSIQERRDYGGNLLSVIYPHLQLEAMPISERDELVQWLIDQERQHVAATQSTFYTVLVATTLRAPSNPSLQRTPPG
jgi:SAM-dependent methyltransferase